MTPACPSELRAAFEWIDSAGEWREALARPASYAKAAAKNWRDQAEGGDSEITMSDLRAAIEWHREHVPPKCARCALPAVHGKTRCIAHLAELAEQAKARRLERTAHGRCRECGQTISPRRQGQ